MTKIGLNGWLFFLLISSSSLTLAEGKSDLMLQAVPNLSVWIRDGQVIGRGEIRTQEMHSGYHIWLDAPMSGGGGGRYVILGKGNARNKLHVIISPTGWVPTPKGGDGVIKLTKDVQAYFSVVADGDQIVPADEYSIIVKGGYIEPL